MIAILIQGDGSDPRLNGATPLRSSRLVGETTTQWCGTITLDQKISRSNPKLARLTDSHIAYLAWVSCLSPPLSGYNLRDSSLGWWT